MYAPKPFKIESKEEILNFIKENSLATIVSNDTPYPIASHIPLIVKGDKLLGHFSRANPHIAHLQFDPNVLLVFSGAQGYISAAAKDPENLSILPTWDYQIVHGIGKLQFVDEEGLIAMLHDLMAIHESKEEKSLHIDDYPPDVFKKKLKGIIGFEIKIEDWTACFRLNQNRTVEERTNIKTHLKGNSDLVNAINQFNSKK